MEIVHSRCAGMDVSKRDAKVCVRVAGRGRRKTVETVCTWGSTTNAILTLREHLINEQVSLVVMEATGDYWKPFYYLLEDADFEVMLVNARHVKNLPGRKSDVSDAAWLAQLGAHGLVRGSFVPPPPIRQLRDLTRARTAMTRERGREDPTVREAVGGRRDQIVLSGQRHHLRVRPVDAASLDRWPT
jgi:transposase